MTKFDKSRVRLAVPLVDGLELRSVDVSDLENLRQWKNQCSHFFFHQQYITPEQQQQWYKAYAIRPYDLMLMTVYAGNVFGCMGIRFLDTHWDIYNVILGEKRFGKQGLMGKAFDVLLGYAFTLKYAPITLQVLKHNPAVSWYKNHGFIVLDVRADHFFMTFQSKIEKQ